VDFPSCYVRSHREMDVKGRGCYKEKNKNFASKGKTPRASTLTLTLYASEQPINHEIPNSHFLLFPSFVIQFSQFRSPCYAKTLNLTKAVSRFYGP